MLHTNRTIVFLDSVTNPTKKCIWCNFRLTQLSNCVHIVLRRIQKWCIRL